MGVVTFETPLAPCGGIAAVMGRLPGYVQKASGLDTIVVTPFHHRIPKTNSLKMQVVETVSVWFEGDRTSVSLCRYDDTKTFWPWYFLKPENQEFFTGYPNPYLVGDTPEDISDTLRRDSLVFGASVAEALNVISPDVQWILMMQDWEAATTA